MKIIKASDFIGRPADESNDCAVKAFSIISGKTWAEINNMFVAVGRKPRKGVSIYMCDAIAKKLGLERVAQYQNRKAWLCKTLKQFKDEYKQASAVLIKNRHAFAYDSGEPCDFAPIGNSTRIRVAYFKKAMETVVYETNAKGQYLLPL